MKRTIRPHLVLALAMVATAAARAQTTGYLLPCSAASQLGRGCTLLAGEADAAGMLANPASLVTLGARALSVSGAAFLPTMDYTNAVNPRADGKNNAYPLPAVSYAHRATGPFVFGAGAQTLGGMGADYRLTHPVLGSNVRYRSKFGLMKGGVAAAVSVNHRLALGASVGALYGQLEFMTPYSLSPLSFAGMAGLAQDPAYAPLFQNFPEATAYAELRSLSGFALTAGASALYRPSAGLAFAVAYTFPSTVTMGGGTAALDLNAQFGQLYQGMVQAKGGDTMAVNTQLSAFGVNLAGGMASTFKSAVDFGIPQTLTFAVGARPADRWSVGLDLGWIGYRHAFEYMPVRLTGGSNANINILMNADPANGSFAAGWPLEWKDSWVVRGGVEWTASPGLALRGGLMYGTNPVPSSTLFTIFPAIVQSAASVGVGYRFGPTVINLTWAHAFQAGQTAASVHLVAREYGASRNHLAEDMISLGANWLF